MRASHTLELYTAQLELCMELRLLWFHCKRQVLFIFALQVVCFRMFLTQGMLLKHLSVHQLNQLLIVVFGVFNWFFCYAVSILELGAVRTIVNVLHDTATPTHVPFSSLLALRDQDHEFSQYLIWFCSHNGVWYLLLLVSRKGLYSTYHSKLAMKDVIHRPRD